MTNYRRRRRPQKDTSKRYNINSDIAYPEIRLIDGAGAMIGIMSMREARALADEKEMDLIEINPKALPPVIKLIEYSKFKYQMSKSEATNKPSVDKIKTLRVSVRIGPHDLAFQGKKADEFLEKGLKVKLQVQMRGREKSHPEVAGEVIYKFLENVVNPFEYESEPKLMGDSYFAILKPTKKPSTSSAKKVEVVESPK